MKFSLGISLSTGARRLWRGRKRPIRRSCAEIRNIRAIDNHSHPPRVVGAGERDDEFDALPCDPLEPTDAEHDDAPRESPISRRVEGAVGISLR